LNDDADRSEQGRLEMCRLFGLSAGTEPVSARIWLLEAPDSLAA
jgi:hypothetical protein